MTGETRTSLAMTPEEESGGADCMSSGSVPVKWRLRQETSDGRLLTDGTAGRTAAA